ncbi:MAG: mandelate racemase/muconate lactonizing enzyme family protein [Nitrososphaerales archaeon]
MKIKDVIATTLYNPSVDIGVADSGQDNIIVEIVTDEGVSGVGETTSPPAAVKNLIDMRSSHDTAQGLKNQLIGEDPLQIERLWNKMYEATIASGRRGIGIHAIGAIDIALWDLAGKIYDQPVWKLLGGAQKPKGTPYASLYPVQDPTDIEVNKLSRYFRTAKSMGFKAFKVEVLTNSRKRDYELVRASREMLGEDVELMVDAFYCWRDFKTALQRLKELEKFNLYFIEAPLPVDDLDGYAKLSPAVETRVAVGERITTRYEFMELIDRGHVDIAQPDIGRVGGLTEAKKVADYAKMRGVLVTPHCWRTGITTAAALHYNIAVSNCPFFEYMVEEEEVSELGKSLVELKFRVRDGYIDLPDSPGLGIELNRKLVEKYTARSTAK